MPLSTATTGWQGVDWERQSTEKNVTVDAGI